MSSITQQMKDHPIPGGFSELSAILYILSPTRTEAELDQLLKYDESYYSDPSMKQLITFIIDYYTKHNHQIPSYIQIRIRFQDLQLPDDPIIYDESADVIEDYIIANKGMIYGTQAAQIIQSSYPDTIFDSFDQIETICREVRLLNTDSSGKQLKGDADEREKDIIERNSAAKVPTGIPELDAVMGGGLSTYEELFLLIARTNVGKSWVCAKFAASAAKAGQNVLYYSPEMEGTMLLTRVDTWLGEGKFKNNDISNGKFNTDYDQYLSNLPVNDKLGEVTVIDNTDVSDGSVTVPVLKTQVATLDAKLVIIDGLSYMEDTQKAFNTSERYRNICQDLYQMSKDCHCAVVIVMQANRETKNNTDDDPTKGFPDLYNVEGSDHPGRIATAAIALKKDTDKETNTQTLSIRIQKMRTHMFDADNILTYTWNQNIGEMVLKTDESSKEFTTSTDTTINIGTGNMPTSGTGFTPMFGNSNFSNSDESSDDDNVEF